MEENRMPMVSGKFIEAEDRTATPTKFGMLVDEPRNIMEELKIASRIP